MKGTLKLGSVSGISVQIHWTLSLLFVWLFGLYLFRGATVGAALTAVSLVGVLFACVVMHELGHALTAKRFGIQTRDITLYPFGGIAMLTGRQMKPVEELAVAAAGPAVNLAIAAVLFFVSATFGIAVSVSSVFQPGGFLGTIAWLNLGLAAFNMIPAFPMDGGRVLRAGLATRIRYETATQIAIFFGVAIAGVFVVVGLATFNPMLAFIGLFVFVGAAQEGRRTG